MKRKHWKGMKTYLGKIPNSHVRDFQRKKVYSAEATCKFWSEVEILSLEEVKKLITDIAIWASIPIFLTGKNHFLMILVYLLLM